MTYTPKYILSSVLFALSLVATATAAELKPLQDWMQSLVDSGRVVGCMAQVTQGGETIFLKAIGDRNPGSDEDLTIDQVVRIYSMSKAITSTAVMQLVEQGRLGIDDPVSMYIPEFSNVKVWANGVLEPPRRGITIRDLLRHTSGLAYDFSAPPELAPRYKDFFVNVRTLDEAGRKMAHLPLAEQPGTAFVYGLNTDVLGRVVEVVAGMDFESYLRENIFTPLSMTDTGFTPSSDLKAMQIVTPRDGQLVVDAAHYAHEGRILKPQFPSGGGGLWSTLGDYTRFCMAIERHGELDGNRILRPDTVRFMTQNQLGPGIDGSENPGAQRFGLGFGIQGPVQTSAGLRGGGRWTWGGAACTYFFIDARQDLTAVFATQQFPFNGEMNNGFHHAVLESIARHPGSSD